MFERLADRIPFAKIFTVLGIVAGVSLGLCAVTFFISFGGNGEGGYWTGIWIAEVVAMWVSIAGLLLTLLVFVALSIFGGFREKVSQVSIIPKDDDDTRIDKNETSS